MSDSPHYYGYGPYSTEPQSYWSPPPQGPQYSGPPPAHVPSPAVNTGHGSPQGFVGGFNMMPLSASPMAAPAYSPPYSAGGYVYPQTHSPAGSYSSDTSSSVRSFSNGSPMTGSYYDDPSPAAGYQSGTPPSPIYASGSSEGAHLGRTNTTSSGHSHQTMSAGVKDGRRHRVWNKITHLSDAASKLVAD